MAQVDVSADAGISDASAGDPQGEVAAEIPFQDFCGLLEKINGARGTDKKKKLFATFLKQWRQVHKRLHPPSDAQANVRHSDTFFPVMRLLIPQVDKARPAYGLKETALAKQYIDILNIARESRDAKKLLNYRAPTAAQQDAGDFAAVAYFILRNRCPERGRLTVAQVNDYLDDLANSNTKKDRLGVKKALQLLLRNTSALEQKWLIRIILKNMKTGLSENSVFSEFHPDAVDLFNVCSDMAKVCSDLADPDFHLNEASISYFTPFRPMLGERANIDQVLKLMDHQPFLIETKFDGERMQLHKQGNQYRYFSRSSKDYTASFGASQYEGSFSPKIHGAFNSVVKSCILDGEMVGWHKATDEFVPKGDNVDIKAVGASGGDDDGDIQQCFVVFDLLMVNTTNLANQPLTHRIEQLKKIFCPVKGVLHLVDRQEGTTKEEVVSALNVAIDNREEGLVVKQPNSTYQPDKRKGGGWLKIKPEYVDRLSDQLDLIIVGGYFGVGRRSGMISHFLCALAVPPEQAGERPSVFHSFCRVGSGYTQVELSNLGMKLKPHWKKFDEKHPPDSVLLAPGFKLKPDLWIEPQNSKIVQVRAAEITVSDRYKCGCTLRFPRVEKVREDKAWYDCTNLDELDQLKQMGGGKLFHRLLDGDDITEQMPAVKKRRAGTGIERPRGVASQFRPTDVSNVRKVSKMFEGKEFCVINGSRGLSKEDAERRLAEHGGTFVQNPGPNTDYVMVHKVIVRASNIISAGLHDVVKMDWLLQCLEEKKCLPLVPSVLLHTSPATANVFSGLYDKYGDSYTEDVTDESLRDVFKKIDEVHPGGIPISREEMATIEDRYFAGENERGLFRKCKFYLDKFVEIGNVQSAIKDSSLELAELQIQLHGGQVVESFDGGITHIVFDTCDLSRVSQFRGLEREHSRKQHFITLQWVKDSIESCITRNERLYEPNKQYRLKI